MKKIIIPIVILSIVGVLLGVLYVKLGQTAEAMSSLTVTSSSEAEGVTIDLAASAAGDNVTAAVNSEIINVVSDNVAVEVNNVFSVDARGTDETQDEFVQRLGQVMSGSCMKGSSPYISAWSQQVFDSQLLCSGTFAVDDSNITYENGYSCFYGVLTLKVGSLTSAVDDSFFGQAITASGEYTFDLKVSFNSSGLIEMIEVVE